MKTLRELCGRCVNRPVTVAIFTLGFGCCLAGSGELVQLSREELADGWISLFDGETLFGWQPNSRAEWRVTDGVLSVSAGEKGLLLTTSEFADYVLNLDFRALMTTNSGVFLRTPAQPSDPAADCYELNIATEQVSPFATGSFVGRKKARSQQASGDWQTYEVIAQGGHFTVKLNGEVVLDYTDPKPIGRGFIGLQFNQGLVEFRNVKLKPLGTEPVFNGRDLDGWRTQPGQQTVVSVTPAGELHLRSGKGQLETIKQFGDFTLQVEAYLNGKDLNSGVFFRCIPGEMMNGYECQLDNRFKDGDRTQPIDCGTGGFYRRQNARRVMADDQSWFHLTLIATGPHMAAWVNGYQVSDWTDQRGPHENPRQGSRTKPGTIALQGHDPTTDLLFRNLRAGEMASKN